MQPDVTQVLLDMLLKIRLEAYNIGTFKQLPSKKRSCSQPINNQHLYSIENISLSSNKESVEYMQNSPNSQDVPMSKNNINKTDGINKGNSCAPLQVPTYIKRVDLNVCHDISLPRHSNTGDAGDSIISQCQQIISTVVKDSSWKNLFSSRP